MVPHGENVTFYCKHPWKQCSFTASETCFDGKLQTPPCYLGKLAQPIQACFPLISVCLILTHHLSVFQSPRGYSSNFFLIAWYQKLKLVSLVMWNDDLKTHNTHDVVSQHFLTHTSPTPCHRDHSAALPYLSVLQLWSADEFFTDLVNKQMSVFSLRPCWFEPRFQLLSLCPVFYKAAGIIIKCKLLKYHFDPPPAWATAYCIQPYGRPSWGWMHSPLVCAILELLCLWWCSLLMECNLWFYYVSLHWAISLFQLLSLTRQVLRLVSFLMWVIWNKIIWKIEPACFLAL